MSNIEWNVTFPCKPGDKVYKVVYDKRVKEPKEYVVAGYWINGTDNQIHLVRYVDEKFYSSISVNVNLFGVDLFVDREDAVEKMNNRGENKYDNN